jgi:leucyl aminopeptidase
MTASNAIPVLFIAEGSLAGPGLTAPQIRWAEANGFSGQRGRLLAIPGETGEVSGYLFGTGPEQGRSPFVAGLAAAALPAGTYSLEGDIADQTLAAIAFRLGSCRFDRYREAKPGVVLQLPVAADAEEVERQVIAATMARDLINTPSNDLGPENFQKFVETFAAERGMTLKATVGDDLVAQNLPVIHAVGRASAEAPRLLDLSWGREDAPRVTLVGKGVTFDTGGLDIKSAAGMLLMKKDMGGAANILGLAHLIVSANLPVRLRVLLPIVENAISSNAFRPGDVLRSRRGITIEIGNTDAEGRLILADALTLADEEAPDLLIDMATLTGAARVALGPDLPPIYSNDLDWAAEIAARGGEVEDPLWPMPLWSPYESQLTSKIADINNAGTGGFAGSVIAALFLRRFVTQAKTWLHLDIFGWAPEARAGRTVGGTDQGMRALYEAIKARYPG